ncbi:MAG: hypothetical protein QHC67_08870 [Sphingobium sp.]|nr:hypothetical protein [Sphingobium sp.]MDX3909918.1 hypothetical protein [Sphingobium sp.]
MGKRPLPLKLKLRKALSSGKRIAPLKRLAILLGIAIGSSPVSLRL